MGVFGQVKRAVELHQDDDNDIPPDRWQNRDLVPLPPVWSTVFLTIYGWQATSSLLSFGLNVRQSITCTIIARILQYLVVPGLGWIGGVWHISFTVQARYTFGIWGSILPLLVRVGVTCVWYGVQAFTGGLLVSAILSAIFSGYQNLPNTLPASASMTTKEIVGFRIYNIIALPLLYLPPDKLRRPLRVAVITSALPMAMATTSALPQRSSQALNWVGKFMHGITTLLGGNAVGMTSQTDFSRFARRPQSQVWGQAFGVLFFGMVVPVFGILGTSAAGKLYGDVTGLGLWNPPSIVQLWLDRDYQNPKIRAAAFFTALGLLLNVLGLNSVENGVSGGMDFAGLCPRYINIRRGSYLIAGISIALNPWYIIAKASSFTSALNSFGIILGPMMGVFTADYYLARRQKVKLSDLYHPGSKGIYYFTRGINFRAYVSWILGWVPTIGGMAMVNPANSIPSDLVETYYTGFITGYVISFLAHWGLNVVFPPKGLGEVDSYDSFGTFTPEEAASLGIEPNLGERINPAHVDEHSYEKDIVVQGTVL
ncbi:permease for cytosine/purines, uracil, thiamine, allantoin-domain-containing protein [Aspergillus cavernicola]|uniref:Permease for cytosine/purines, uracil, thiamine, allantoin-domain-containing protein n=1 Tax=Aspergillus cavernicola TaxID=176166 RepID=A0ABR4HPD6_9EURO